MRLKRRDIILGGLSLGAGALVYAFNRGGPQNVRDLLSAPTEGLLGPRNPDVIGDLSAVESETLWRLVGEIERQWTLSSFVNLDKAKFLEVLHEKTAKAPSYLTEYRQATELIDALSARTPDWPNVVLLRNSNDIATTFGRARRFVVDEFIDLIVAFGGFRFFGYANYRGFVGGPFSNPAHLPYRSA